MRKVAVLHEKTQNQRKDFLHKASSEIAGHYETVCVEDLNIAGMIEEPPSGPGNRECGLGHASDLSKIQGGIPGRPCARMWEI